MNLTGRITGMIMNPGETIKDISEHPYIEEAVLIVGITAIFTAISAYLMQSKIIYDFSDMDTSGLEAFQLKFGNYFLIYNPPLAIDFHSIHS